MTRTISLVQHVQIASPCHVKWDDMTGDDRVRFCISCKLNVYNLSAMTEEEGEKLILENDGQLCARIYRRYDGTILTRDCPVGWRALRRRAMWIGFRALAAMVCIVSGVTLAVHASRPRIKSTPEIEQFLAAMEQRRPSTYVSMVTSAKRWLTALPPAPQPRALGRCGNDMMGRLVERPVRNTPPAVTTPAPAPGDRGTTP